uniref:Vitellogenin n=1 Tax=Ditylenchus dipsaci TaxID=166011 RepID=A0A915DI75_9BILA
MNIAFKAKLCPAAVKALEVMLVSSFEIEDLMSLRQDAKQMQTLACYNAASHAEPTLLNSVKICLPKEPKANTALTDTIENSVNILYIKEACGLQTTRNKRSCGFCNPGLYEVGRKSPKCPTNETHTINGVKNSRRVTIVYPGVGGGQVIVEVTTKKYLQPTYQLEINQPVDECQFHKKAATVFNYNSGDYTNINHIAYIKAFSNYIDAITSNNDSSRSSYGSATSSTCDPTSAYLATSCCDS